MNTLRTSRLAWLTLSAAALSCIACGGAHPTSSDPASAKETSPAESDPKGADQRRMVIQKQAAGQLKQLASTHDAIEAGLIRQLTMAQGKDLPEPAAQTKLKPNGKPRHTKERPQKKAVALSSAIATLRGIGMKIVIVPMDNVLDGFFRIDEAGIKQFYEAKKRRLTAPEQEAYDAVVGTLGPLSALASQAQISSLMSHFMVISHAAAVANLEVYFDVPQNEVDIEITRAAMLEERRSETLAAASAGLVAAIRAVLDASPSSPGDPKALDEIVRSFGNAMPVKVEVSPTEAKAFLDGFKDGLGDTRARYEAMLDTSLPTWKKLGIGRYFDDSFKFAEAGVPDDQRAKRRARSTRPSSTPTTSEAPRAAANKALDNAARSLPGDERLKKGLSTFEALKSGDPKAIATAALSFVPEGPIKMGLDLVMKLVF